MPLDPCPHCGKDFDHDNAGARSNHVRSCAEEAAKYQQQAQPAQQGQQPAQTAQQAQPAQGQGQVPARTAPQSRPAPRDQQPQQQQTGLVSQETGQQIAQMQHASPKEKAQVRGQLMTSALDMAKGFFQARAEQDVRDAERAEGYEGQPEPADQYPRCPECGRQLVRIPEPGTEFPCENCGERLIA